jgi:hypothetical protein
MQVRSDLLLVWIGVDHIEDQLLLLRRAVSGSELSVYLTGDDLDVARPGCSRLLMNVQYRT